MLDTSTRLLLVLLPEPGRQLLQRVMEVLVARLVALCQFAQLAEFAEFALKSRSRRLLRRAAVFLWITPLVAALSIRF